MELLSHERRALFQAYTREFEEGYLLEPAGQRHLASYSRERDAVRQYWELTKDAEANKKAITDLVLEKLLPYANTSHNREMGYRISVMPAITRDLRRWFENAGWQEPENWPNVAHAIFDLIFELVEHHNWDALVEFEADEKHSKGFRTGMLTPTLYFLNSEYRIINSKTIDTVNFLLQRRAIDNQLSTYRENLKLIDKAFDELDILIFEDRDIADAFFHWMCDKRLGGHARIEAGPDIRDVTDEVHDEGRPVFDSESEPQNHWEAIYYIIRIGNLLGYKTYVADPSRSAFDQRLGDAATLSEIPHILKSASEIGRVDAIWYQPRPPFFFFEVEDGGTMRDALHRLYNTMAFDARFFIVSPLRNRSKFERWVTTEPFREFQDRYNFRTYAELFQFYLVVKEFTSFQSRFLEI